MAIYLLWNDTEKKYQMKAKRIFLLAFTLIQMIMQKNTKECYRMNPLMSFIMHHA